MKNILLHLLGASALFAINSANSAVVLTTPTSDPSIGSLDQYTFNQAGPAVPTEDYTDNAGAPGQSFSTGSQPVYLNSVSFKINIANTFFDFSFNGISQWGLQIARFDNVASGGFGERTDDNGNPYSSQYINSNITRLVYNVTSPNGNPTSDFWLTFTFTGVDIITLNANSTYAFSVYAPSGFHNIYRSGSNSYAGGTGFRPYGNSGVFNDNYVQTSGWDRTFHVGLTAVPEPSSAVLIGVGLSCLIATRRRA